MRIDEVKKLWPDFQEWIHKKKGYATAGGFYLIALWYEFLLEKGRRQVNRKQALKSSGGILS